MINYAIAAIVGYLLGSIPFGLIITNAAGLGDVRAIDVTWSYVYSSGRRVAVAGVGGVVVVETPDEVLVLGIDSSQKVKDLLGP